MLPPDRDRDLGRHLAECPDCRARAEEVREATASLRRLADATRMDLSADGAEALFRRARMGGLLGRKPRRSIGAWAGRTAWVRWGVPAAMAAAAILLIVFGLWTQAPQPVSPRGALERLVRAGLAAQWAGDLRPLGPLARAAVSQELAQPEPDEAQVADLLLVAYIAERPREDRQTRDVRFLLRGIWTRRPRTAAARGLSPWDRLRCPMLASTGLATAGLTQATAAGAAGGRAERTPVGEEAPLAAAKRRVLDGEYAAAMDLLPSDGRGAVLKAWCLASLDRKAEAALVLAEADQVSGTPLARLLRADLMLGAGEVTEAVKEYEDLAERNNRCWFAAGYLYRYELRDGKSAGACFRRLQDGPLAEYVQEAFRTELAMTEVPAPEPLLAADFDAYDPGPMPANWALVRVKGGEFEVVAVPGGRAVSQGPGTEFVTGRSEWADYTMQVDVKVVEARDDYVVGAVAYRQTDQTGYRLELTPQRLQIVKQLGRPGSPSASLVGQTHRLVLPPAEGWWYTLKVRVQQVGGGVNVAGKVWRTDTPEPLGWHVAWTDTGQADGGPLTGGRAGVRVRGARVLIDNLVVTRNGSSEELAAASP